MNCKKLLALTLSVMLLLSFAACGAPAEKTAVKICGIKGPTGIGLANMWAADDAGTAKNDYTFSLVSVPADAGNKVVTGEADIAAVPTNLASALYNKTNGAVQMLAVNTLGVLHILENSDTVQTFADLKGKTIYSTGAGANPEYILRHLLTKNGINPDTDVTLKFVAENDELATLMVTGEAKIALVPEPVVTTVLTKNAAVRKALDVTAEWKKLGEGELMMGCVIVKKSFAEANPKAVKNFLKDYEASINSVNEDIDGTAALCEKYEIIPKAAVAKKAIPGCNITFVDGKDMKNQIAGYFNVLNTAKPAAIGGKLPADDFYYGA